MTKYWIGVASREHVLKGVMGGFAQVCHGKIGPLQRMHMGDKIIYYSPSHTFQGKDRCQCFTAIGEIISEKPYSFQMSEDFIPWRVDVKFQPCHEAPLLQLVDDLSFIKDKKRYGYPFRFGCFEISAVDYQKIANKMAVKL